MIRTLPKKLTELGRIRIGDQEANPDGKGKHPRKLDLFRLTSANKPLLHFAANLYGGEVRPWDDAPSGDQWELYTTTNSIDVLIPTASAVSVNYEIWGRGGCTLRCNGCLVTHSTHDEQVGSACLCPEDDHERAELAKDGRACARILRLNVLLPDLPGMGAWRLETKGYYATAELLGTLEMLQGAGMEHTIVEAMLRLEQRVVKRDGKTRRFNTPVLWPKCTPRQLLSGSVTALLLAPIQEPEKPKSLEAHIEELYGKPAPVTPRQTPMGVEDDSTARIMPRQSPLGVEIDGIMAAMGVSLADQAAAWDTWQRKYPSMPYQALAQIRDKLQARRKSTPLVHDEQEITAKDDPETLAIFVARNTAVGKEIDALLRMHYPPENVEFYWRTARTTYPDLTPGALTILRDKLVSQIVQKPGPDEDGVIEDGEPMTLWEQEEADGR